MGELKLKILMDAVERVSAPFRRATQSTDQLKVALKGATETVRNLEKAQAGIEAFGRLKEQARANATALAAAQEKAQTMGRELAMAEGGTKKAQAAFAAARRDVNRLEAAQVSIARETAIMRTRLGEAGIDTKHLATAQRQLKRDLDAARIAATKQATALDMARAKTEALAKARAKLQGAQDMQGKLAMNGAVGMATGGGILAAGAPMISNAGDFEYQLTSYGLTAGQSGTALEQVKDRMMALSEQFHIAATDMLEGQNILVGKGLKPDNALNAMDTIGRAVTATGAQMADMSGLAFSAMDNLKVPQAELAKAFDIMAKAGDEGGFELKNMATYFPQLTSAAKDLGMSGNKAIASMAAALQIATKGAADPSEAANNMSNFLKAFTGEAAVKNFEKVGIDLKAAMQKGLMAGEDPIETMMKTVGQAVGADLEKEMSDAMEGGVDPKDAAEKVAARFKLSEFFGDAQAQNFLSPMLANMAEYRRIRDEALAADGTVNQKFAVMMETYNLATQGLGVSWRNLSITIGTTMLPVLKPVISGLHSIVQGVNAFATANPNLTRGLVIVAGAMAVLIAAGGALSIAMASVIGPFAMAKFAMAAISIQGGIAATAMSGLGTVLTGLGTVLKTVSLFFLTNPIGLAITAIIGLGTILYATFEPFQKLVDGIFDTVKGIFGFGDKKPPELTAAVDKAKTISPATDAPTPLANAVDKAKAITPAPATPTPLANAVDKAKALSPAPSAPMKVASTTAMAAVVAAPMAAAAAPAPAAVAPINMGGVTIVVNAAAGQSETEIAKLVRIELEKWQARQRTDARGRLYDGEK